MSRRGVLADRGVDDQRCVEGFRGFVERKPVIVVHTGILAVRTWVGIDEGTHETELVYGALELVDAVRRVLFGVLRKLRDPDEAIGKGVAELLDDVVGRVRPAVDDERPLVVHHRDWTWGDHLYVDVALVEHLDVPVRRELQAALVDPERRVSR